VRRIVSAWKTAYVDGLETASAWVSSLATALTTGWSSQLKGLRAECESSPLELTCSAGVYYCATWHNDGVQPLASS